MGKGEEGERPSLELVYQKDLKNAITNCRQESKRNIYTLPVHKWKHHRVTNSKDLQKKNQEKWVQNEFLKKIQATPAAMLLTNLEK